MILFQVILIIILLILSAAFSGFETALFTFPRIKIQSYLYMKRRYADIIHNFLTRPRRILITILTGNLLVNIGASSVLTLITINLIHTFHLNKTIALLIEFVVMSYILLLIGEITPKALAIRYFEPITFKLAPLMQYINLLFLPISTTLDNLSNRFLPKIETRKMDFREIDRMLQEARSANIIEADELEIARQLFGLSKKTVSQIMTPAPDVISIRDNATLGEAKKKINRSKHSRLVVFESKTKSVVGVLYGKDIVFADNNLLVRDFMREPHFVPETKNLEMLLNEFRRRGIHIAMVTDEFGDFVGIITLEDILESLVGEIIDEYDETGDIPYQSLGDNLYLFDGGVSIQNVYHILKPGHFEESGERLSAFLFRNFGHIPKEGESLSYHGLIFTIKEIKGRKIKKVIVQRQ